MSELKTSCINPCCNSVAYIRENGRGDDYFTCSKCGPYNGKGKAFREWMQSIRSEAAARDVAAEKVSQGETSAQEYPQIEPKPEPVEEKTGDWLSEL
ncbi:hypothetical protein HF888_07760 [Bermanella marisrubri]|nr:hypothetical protein [Bermanella marisrubri]QIZ84128.1 hypothetical protein HF888_07760 [Bermanella marisrubri]